MCIEEIIQSIVTHPEYAKLNWVQRERIACPVSIRWVLLASDCMRIDSNRTLAGLAAHASISDDFKPIYKDILQEAV